MSATLITADPNFGKSYRTVIGIEDYTSYILISNQPTIAIPTDSLGNNGVFTNATSTVQVILNNEDVTTDWTVSLHQATGCTVTVSNTTKVATVTAMSADTGFFIVKAVKVGENTLYTKVIVYKAKAGTNGIDGDNGTGVPDDETIVLNGSNELKVRDFTYYNTTGSILNSTAFKGSVSFNNTTNNANNNLISIGGGLTANGATNSISIGQNNSFYDGNGSNVTNDKNILIGHDLQITGWGDSPQSNIILIGKGTRVGHISVENAVGIGARPSTFLPNSTSICFDRGTYYFEHEFTRNAIIFGQNQGRSLSGSETITISIPIQGLSTFDYSIVKLDIDLFGTHDSKGRNGVYKTKKSVTYVHQTKVLDIDTAAESYSSSPLTGTTWSIANSFTTTIDISIVVPATTYATAWFANYKIDLLA